MVFHAILNMLKFFFKLSIGFYILFIGKLVILVFCRFLSLFKGIGFISNKGYHDKKKLCECGHGLICVSITYIGIRCFNRGIQIIQIKYLSSWYLMQRKPKREKNRVFSDILKQIIIKLSSLEYSL